MSTPPDWAMAEARARIGLLRRASPEDATEFLAALLSFQRTHGEQDALKKMVGELSHVAD